MVGRASAMSHFTAFRDADGYPWAIVCASGYVLDLAKGEETVYDLAKDDMLAVEEIARLAGDEELASVCVGARVGHAEQARGIVFELEVFIVKLVAIDAQTSCAVGIEKVASLTHKITDDSVKDGVLVALRLVVQSVLARAELTKVFGGPVG